MLHLIVQLKGALSAEEAEHEISVQRVWINQLEEDDDEEWIDL